MHLNLFGLTGVQASEKPMKFMYMPDLSDWNLADGPVVAVDEKYVGAPPDTSSPEPWYRAKSDGWCQKPWCIAARLPPGECWHSHSIFLRLPPCPVARAPPESYQAIGYHHIIRWCVHTLTGWGVGRNGADSR
jgi:hypothetical protein